MSVRIGKCTMCDKPAVGAINANANMNALSEARWEPRCDEHNPYWNQPPDFSEVIKAARDARFSDEYIGNLFRAALKRDKAE